MTLPPALAPLGQLRQWVTYRLVPADNGKTDKLPCNWQTGHVSSAQEPGNWGTYDQAIANHELADVGHGSGAGFVVSPGDPYWFLDIDKCLLADNTWSPLALELCRRLPGAAIEVSQSGRGLHIIGRGTIPKHRCKNIPLGLELYSQFRFVAITGSQTSGSVDTDLTAALASVVDQYFAPQAGANGPLDDWTSEPCEGWAGHVDDAALIQKAIATKPRNDPAAMYGRGDEKVSFAQLWTKDEAALAKRWPQTNSNSSDAFDHSSADGALAMRLAYWTGRDCERTERLMRMSGLMREKYERRNYIEPTIMRAAGACKDVYDGEKKEAPPPPLEVPGPPGKPGRVLSLLPDQAKDKGDHLTVEYWLVATGHIVSYDEFADRYLINGKPLTDSLERSAWFACREMSGLKIPKDLFGEALRHAGDLCSFHPLREWLAAAQAQWDGTPRIDNWLTTHLGAETSPLIRAVGAIFLIAAVRRARQPGAKFDEMMVLEGEQGTDKSTAIQLLSPEPSWFCDDVHVGMKSKELLEVTAGKWIVEAPELSRMGDSEVEHIKALLSRQVDQARMAYGRNSTERGRQWVPFATTNAAKWLRDATGNRRFWPVRIGMIDLAAIMCDRTQLWAEAATREAAGVSIRLARELWADAAIEQDARMIDDPFEEVLSDRLDGLTGRIKVDAVWRILGIDVKDRRRHTRALGDAMRRMGWAHARNRFEGERMPVYKRGTSDVEIGFRQDNTIGPLVPVLTVVPGGRP